MFSIDAAIDSERVNSVRTSSQINPISILNAAQTRYPDFFRHMPALHVKSRQSTQAWCYAPFEDTATLFTEFEAKRARLGKVHHTNLATLFYEMDLDFPHQVSSVLAAWRATKGIYKFDSDLLAALVRTTEVNSVPTASMLRLPHWCVYIELQGKLTWEGSPVNGVFAMLAQESVDSTAPRLMLVVSTMEFVVSLAVPLEGQSLDDALKVLFGKVPESSRTPSAPIRKFDGHASAPNAAKSMDVDAIRRELPAILNLLLYLCADNADFGERDRPSNPAMTKTRKGPKLFCAQAVTSWDVGVRVGADLRRAEAVSRGSTTSGESASCTREQSPFTTRPRPHIRCAHWHHFWTGPRTQSDSVRDVQDRSIRQQDSYQRPERKQVLRWVMPTLINGSCSDTLPAVVRDLRAAAN